MNEPAPAPTLEPGRRVLAFVGSVIAPTSLVTGLLFYFGQLHAQWYYLYFGVNASILDLGPTDYLYRSADGLFIPFLTAAGAAAVGLGVARVLRTRPCDRRRIVWSRRAGVAAYVVAVVVAGFAVLGLSGTPTVPSMPWLDGLGLAGGVLLAAAGDRLHHAGRPLRARSADVAVAIWAARFALVAVGLFWAVGAYSVAAGRGRAHHDAQSLAGSPDVTVFSEKSLALHVAGVTETACTEAGSAYAVRYDGLKLVIRSGDQYVFLPSTWRPGTGVAIVLPRTDALRLEFAAPGAPRAHAC